MPSVREQNPILILDFLNSGDTTRFPGSRVRFQVGVNMGVNRWQVSI
jgi:hypothetical protein